MRNFLFLLTIAGSVNALAWDSDVYESVRERTVLAGTERQYRTEVLRNGVVRHFAWDKDTNEIAERLASFFAARSDAKESADRFWSNFEAVMSHPNGEVGMAILLSRRASESVALSEAFKEKISALPQSPKLAFDAAQAQLRQAYEQALQSTKAPTTEVLAFANETKMAPNTAPAAKNPKH